MENKPNLRVLYNDTCPICSREIGLYARAAGDNVEFCPLNSAASFGLDTDSAARQLHVVQNGQLLAGLDAFIALWASLRGWRWAARIAQRPIIRPILGVAYTYIAAPALYRLHLRRIRQSK